jgi:hypothetical protein
VTRLLELPTKYRQPAEPKPRKYRNEPTVYNGVRYDSVKEAQFAGDLDLARHAQGPARVASWERQFRIPLIVNHVTVGHMVVDFLVRYTDGRKELVEIKSPATQTPLFKFKVKILEATWLQDHLDIGYRIQV